jgi:ferredoxin
VSTAAPAARVLMNPEVHIDGERCRGHAICALLLSAHVDLDQWGYPLIDAATLRGRRALKAARRAERACPQHALHVRDTTEPARFREVGDRSA